MEPLTPKALCEATGISQPYASMILNGQREFTQPIAIKLYRATGRKCGPIADASDEEIDVLERFQPRDEAAAA